MSLVPLSMFLKILQDILLTVPRRCFFCGSVLLFTFHVCLYYAVLSIPCSRVITCWERADLLTLLCVMFSCVLYFSHISTANIKTLKESLGALSVNKLSHIPKLQPISAVYENQ